MLPAGLHSRGGNGPHRTVEVDLFPGREARFARAHRGEHRELEGELRRRGGAGPAHRGERGPYGVPCGVVGAVALADGPLHDLPDAKPEPARGLVLLDPQRLRHRHQVRRVDGVHGLAPDASEGVAPQRGAPVPGEPRSALPAGLADGDHRLEGVGEHRGAAGASACGVGVAAPPGYPAIRKRDLADLLERDVCEAAEAELALAAVDGEALDPGLAAAAGAGLDEQVEAAAVAVSPGVTARTNAGLRACCAT